MAEHRFHTVVDLVGSEPTEIDAKLLKGRERNLTATGHGMVRNSRDYEWGYTLHKDAVRAARRIWNVLDAANEPHAAVYVRNPDGRMEPVWSDGKGNASKSTSKNDVLTSFTGTLGQKKGVLATLRDAFDRMTKISERVKTSIK
jgi:hypothetical protein